MIPESIDLSEQVDEEAEPSFTWYLDFERGAVTRMTDGLEAIKQSVLMALLTERFDSVIYSDDYGSELKTLIGSDPIYVETEFTRMVEEALLPDERITGIKDMVVSQSGDEMSASFVVATFMGDVQLEGVKV